MTITIAYIRVSTDDQVDYSPDAQRNRCAKYAVDHELGSVRFLSDEGVSGKNLERPAMRELLRLVEAGEVSDVVVWRLDRLTRDTADLSMLMRLFERQCVRLHSLNEGQQKIDTAAGRMQVGIHGVFAQYYREHIVENVKMGMQQAAEKGRWQNRAPSGYDMVNGGLVPNEQRHLIHRIFELRAEGLSYTAIESATGVKYSTVRHVCSNRVYLGMTRIRDDWYTGIHDPLVTPELFEAAQRANPTGKRRGKDIMSGRIRCGGCGKSICIDYNERGSGIYRCKHRGKGCDIPGRSAVGLQRAARLAMNFLSTDVELLEAIRHELGTLGAGHATAPPSRAGDVAKLKRKRQKLLDLFIDDKIPDSMFSEEEGKLTRQIDAIEADAKRAVAAIGERRALADEFEQLATILRDLDIDTIWNEATETERRMLVNELVDAVIVHPDRLQVAINGAPALNISFEEVGLRPALGTRTLVSEGGLEPPRSCEH